MATTPSRTQPPDESGRLARALWTVAQATAEAHGVRFESGCQQLTEQFVHDGAEILAKENKADDRATVSEALRNTVRYVELIIEDAQAGSTPGELHEYNFQRAQSRFCPCFPFC
jgi:hypothetical protein